MRRIYPECQFCALEDFLTAGTLLRQEGEDEEDDDVDANLLLLLLMILS